MKKTTSFLLFALLCAAAGASSAGVQYECELADRKCPAPPVPPVPPVPPAPSAMAALPAPPAPPAMPAIPAPPPPPPLPKVPEAAHAACAGAIEGSKVTYVIRKGETMSGTCEREGGKMVFQLHTYRVDD